MSRAGVAGQIRGKPAPSQAAKAPYAGEVNDRRLDLPDTETEGGLPELSKEGHTFPLALDAG
jgi:hypothetical protein